MAAEAHPLAGAAARARNGDPAELDVARSARSEQKRGRTGRAQVNEGLVTDLDSVF